MTYRIVEFQLRGQRDDSTVEIGAYDSAYRAMRIMQEEHWRRGGSQPPDWYLIDPDGHILAGPQDISDALVA